MFNFSIMPLDELGGLNMGNFVWSKLKGIPLWESEPSL